MRLVYSLLLICTLAACQSPGGPDPQTVVPDTVMSDFSEVKSFLALGDSYTIGESVEEDDRWPVQLADSLNERGILFDDPEIIARTGWRTDELIAAISDADPDAGYDLVTLLIGVNNQYQGKPLDTYISEFGILLDKALELAGGKPEQVMVLSIPDYGFTPFGSANQETISSELAEYNRINREITEKAGIRYIYITDISENGLANTGLVASDGLHPSGIQYSLWVERILENTSFQEAYIEN